MLPHNLHRPVALEALAANKHVMLEKPMVRRPGTLPSADPAQLSDRPLLSTGTDAGGCAGHPRRGCRHRPREVLEVDGYKTLAEKCTVLCDKRHCCF